MTLPVIDVGPLVGTGGDVGRVARSIDAACRDVGFFYVVGHGVDSALREDLDHLARQFFGLDEAAKAAISMERGGRAWRGWFPVGGEVTSGAPDHKEGLYFGAELGPEDDRVRAGTPMHGANLFPDHPTDLGPAVLDYIDALTALGHCLMRGLSLALGLDDGWFARHLTADPVVLFRIFHYPPASSEPTASADTPEPWGVGPHTDYGLLTILGQDLTGGLQVQSGEEWIDAPPIPDSFVCNLGDMLERMTGGRYKSTPHRVRNTSGADRLSFPFFFDPGWGAQVQAIPGAEVPQLDDGRQRWDGASVHELSGTYGDYLLTKVAKVFPRLGDEVLPPA